MRRLSFASFCLLIAACSPVVRVEPPREPITINLNVKLDADVITSRTTLAAIRRNAEARLRG